nr:ETX/MTX2 family pore-forming toxin [uncultured Chryseobacterium sp.]
MNNKIIIQSSLKTIISGFLVVLSVSSCTNNDNMDAIPNSTSENLGAGLKRSNLSEADLLKAGWTIVKEIKSPLLENTTASSQKNATTSAEQKFNLTAQHLDQLGYDVSNPQTILEKFIYNGIRPDGVNFNSGLKVGSVSSQQTGDAYVLLGQATTSVQSKDFQMPDEVYVSDVVNDTDKEATFSKKYTYKQGYKTTWQRKISGSLKLGAKVSIGLPADLIKGEVSTEVTVGGETTDGTEASAEKTIEDNISVVVPARSKVQVAITTKITKTTVSYSVPMSIMGSAYANYYQKVNDHYFWGHPASGIDNSGKGNFGLTKGKLTSEAGEAAKIASVETKVLLKKAEPIK